MDQTQLSEELRLELAEFAAKTADPDVIKAGQYLVMKDQKVTGKQIAAWFGWSSRSTLYVYLQEWELSGALEKARELLLIPKSEEIKAAYSRVLNSWPQVVERQLKTAIHARSDKTALEAANWLKSAIVDPELALKEDPGSAEQAYANKPASETPMVVTLPNNLLKKR
jgi:hypothetical protein